MDMIDTSKSVAKGILDIYTDMTGCVSVVIQPQFRFHNQRGARTFEGGDLQRIRMIGSCFAEAGYDSII